MKKWILKFYENDVIRYIFWGGCTTLVNLLSFYIMRAMGIPLMSANIISIILAILFAYVVNSRFVFHDRCETWRDHIRPFLKFISARLVTMVIGRWRMASGGDPGIPGYVCKILHTIYRAGVELYL